MSSLRALRFLITVFLLTAGTAYALHSDRQGSVIAVTDQATGTLAARYKYDAFGAREQTVSFITQPYGFTGREYDPEAGLYHYRARTYDPNAGRFLQSDPLGFAAGDLNLFAYTWNDPANWTDPSGLTASGAYGRMSGAIGQMSRAVTGRVGKGAMCKALRLGTFISAVTSALLGNVGFAKTIVTQTPSCRTKARKPCGCGKGGLLSKVAMIASFAFSFPEGTEVLTPNGRVAIESLREGDLVVARNEETGQSGVFPVTAVMGRQAAGVLWLTLENAEGKTTRMGVTSEHPLFIAGIGWGKAGELVAGDAIRDSMLKELTVLAVEMDTTPQMVHNLEIAEAHTYFAGELEAWGHNAILPYWWKPSGGGKLQPYDTSNGQYVCKGVPQMAAKIAAGKFGDGFQSGWDEMPPKRGGGISNKCGYASGVISKILLKIGGCKGVSIRCFNWIRHCGSAHRSFRLV